MTIEITHTKFWRGPQSLFAERIATLPTGQKVRAEIRRDSYDKQSYTRVQILTTEKGWSYLAQIPFAESEVFGFSPYRQSEDWKEAADRDLLALLTIASEVLA